jgi:hypothetical protein
MEVRLSPYESSALYPRKIPGNHLYWRLIRSQGHIAAGMIRRTEKSSGLIGNGIECNPLYFPQTNFLLALIFDPEDKGNRFLRNVCGRLHGHVPEENTLRWGHGLSI